MIGDEDKEINQNKNEEKKGVGLKPNLPLPIPIQIICFIILIIFCLLYIIINKDVYEIYNQICKTFSKYEFVKLSVFNTNRSGYSAVIMENGNILFTGGMNISDDETLVETEIFDVKLKKFVNSANMNISRVGHASILLKDGNILITGGNNYKKFTPFTTLKSAEIYDVKNNKFVLINDMNYEMSEHQMYMLDDGNVLVIYNPNKIELFDVKNSVFKIIKGYNLDDDYMNYKSFYLSNNVILMYPTIYIPQKTPIVTLNLKNFEISKLNIELFSRKTEGYNIARINENMILVTGSSFNNDSLNASIINLYNNEITTINTNVENRYFHNSIEINNGNILFCGGYNGIGTNLRKQKSCNLFISKSNKFVRFNDMNYSRTFPQYIQLNNSQYIIFDKSNNPIELLIIK